MKLLSILPCWNNTSLLAKDGKSGQVHDLLSVAQSPEGIFQKKCWGFWVTSLDNLFQGFIILAVINFFLFICLNRNSCVSICTHCLFSFYWLPVKKSLTPLPYILPSGFVYPIILMRFLFSLFFSKQAHLFEVLFVYWMLLSVNHIQGPELELFQYGHLFLVLESPGLDTILQI